MSAARAFDLVIEGLDEALFVREVTGRERIGECYEIEVAVAQVAEAEPLWLLIEALLGAKATLTLNGADGAERTVSGVVDGFEAAGGGYVVTLAPHLSALAMSARERVHVGGTAADIVVRLAAEQQQPTDVRMQRAPAERAQWLQRGASDLLWMSQVLGSQGVQWWLEHDASGEATLVLGDSAAAHRDIRGEAALPYGYGAEADLNGEACIYAARVAEKLTADAVVLRTVDVDHPGTDLTVSHKSGACGAEVYGYGDAFSSAEEGGELAKRRLAQYQRDGLVLSASSNCRRLEVGRRFVLKDAPHSGMCRTWLVVELQWRGYQPLPGQDNGAAEASRPVFEAQLIAAPSEHGYAPAPMARRASSGALRATVTGPSGSDVHTDALGRITTQYALDRRGKADETASCLARVLQPAMAGAMLVPRGGWEVLVAFESDRHDRPVVLGRLDSGASPAAEALPAGRLRSAMGTPTSPGGGQANALLLDDSAGSEIFTLSTAGDYNERTESNKLADIKGSEVVTIGGDQVTTAGAMSVATAATHALSVGGSREVSAAAGIVVQCGSERVTVGGSRNFAVGGDYHTFVAGSLSRLVGGIRSVTAVASVSWLVSGASSRFIGGSLLQSSAAVSVTVAGASSVTAAGPITLSCAKYALSASGIIDSFGAASIVAASAVSVTAGGAMDLSLGSCTMAATTIVIKAAAKLTVSGGGATIKMTPGKIVFTGAFKAAEPQVASGGIVKHG